jgi:hypothetical protein
MRCPSSASCCCDRLRSVAASAAMLARRSVRRRTISCRVAPAVALCNSVERVNRRSPRLTVSPSRTATRVTIPGCGANTRRSPLCGNEPPLDPLLPRERPEEQECKHTGSGRQRERGKEAVRQLRLQKNRAEPPRLPLRQHFLTEQRFLRALRNLLVGQPGHSLRKHDWFRATRARCRPLPPERSLSEH